MGARLFKNRMVMAGTAVMAILFLVALIGPLLVRYSPLEQDLSSRLTVPGAQHLMGTDDLGRDVFARVVYGSRISLMVGFISVGISLLIGVPLGLIAGFYGGWTDRIIMRIVDMMLCFPTLFLILMVITFLEPSIVNVMIVIGITSWPRLTRYVRGESLVIREREFIQAVRVMGISRSRILFIHMLPNVIAPVIISATLGVGSAILTESVLSFLGLGVQPPNPSWGNILTLGKEYIGQQVWWLMLFPGLAILVTVFSFNMIGEGLRDVLDPRTGEQNG
ncbi:MAG: ABC transporter permease [Elusimicrobiota bacterium]